jgi:hypothetical protein
MILLTTRKKIVMHIGLAIQSAKIQISLAKENQSSEDAGAQKSLDALSALDVETATTQDVYDHTGFKIHKFVCSECLEHVNGVVQFEECKLCEACLKKGFELIYIQ